jgi:TonB family protein
MVPVKKPVFKEALLPEAKQRWGSVGAGMILQCSALAAVIVIPLLIPAKFEAAPHYWVTSIEAPVIEPYKPQPPPPPREVKKPLVVKEVIKPVVVPEPPKPKIYATPFSAPVVKQVAVKKIAAPDPVEVAKDFPQTLGSSAIPTLRKPREQVQTGGFGDPNGVKPNDNASRNPNIAQAGGFDMPTGPGKGNGTGGAKGAQGVVASTGFGNGVAQGGTGGGGVRGSVQQGVFADEKASDAPKVKQAAQVSNTNPVEILYRPKPVYTEEGRSKRVEGDVLVQVVFKANGEVQVERVVRGLGYGLDEAAEAAARQIKFKPATQNGQPVDFPAVAHITFELAY